MFRSNSNLLYSQTLFFRLLSFFSPPQCSLIGMKCCYVQETPCEGYELLKNQASACHVSKELSIRLFRHYKIMSVLSVFKKSPFINLSYATFKFQYIHPRLGCLGWNSTLIWVFCSVTLTGEKMILLRNVINVDAFKLDFPNIL